MRTKEVKEAIEDIKGIDVRCFINGMYEVSTYIVERAEKVNNNIDIVLNYISELEKIIDVMKPSEITYRIKLAENYLHKDEIRAIKEECKKEGCCSDELKEYYDNKCVTICKYYEVCKRVDKLLGE